MDQLDADLDLRQRADDLVNLERRRNAERWKGDAD